MDFRFHGLFHLSVIMMNRFGFASDKPSCILLRLSYTEHRSLGRSCMLGLEGIKQVVRLLAFTPGLEQLFLG